MDFKSEVKELVNQIDDSGLPCSEIVSRFKGLLRLHDEYQKSHPGNTFMFGEKSNVCWAKVSNVTCHCRECEPHGHGTG